MNSGQAFSYEGLGVQRVINAVSWVTRLGGSVMPAPVVQAMSDASGSFIDMHELNRKAGEVIARLTGAEAGLVTAGASAGMVLQAAAVIAGRDEDRIARLPDTRGLKSEIVIHRVHRVGEDRNYLTAGARFVEIGNSAATHEWELEAAIGEKTAAVAYVYGPPLRGAIPLERVVRIAHARGVPVIVDAAAMLPPPENLTRYVAMGPDMVTFSGGKGVRGPQSTGILCGRRDLIEAAYLSSSPNERGIGRAAKVCKEEIAGLLVALELLVDSDYEQTLAGWREKCRHVVTALHGIAGVRAELAEAAPERDEAASTHPRALIFFDDSGSGPREADVVEELRRDAPPIWVASAGPHGGIAIVPVALQDGDEEIIASRLRSALLSSG